MICPQIVATLTLGQSGRHHDNGLTEVFVRLRPKRLFLFIPEKSAVPAYPLQLSHIVATLPQAPFDQGAARFRQNVDASAHQGRSYNVL